MEDRTRPQIDLPRLMMRVLDRLANGEAFDRVVEETGITARVGEAIRGASAVNDGHPGKQLAGEPAAEVVEAGSPAPAFMVIQEGGSSGEIYVHSHPTLEEAEADRISCSEDAYRTSRIIEVPPALAQLGETFYEVLEDALRASIELDYVDVPVSAEHLDG